MSRSIGLTHIQSPSKPRRIAAWLGLAIAILLGPVGAVAGFLAAALVTSHVIGMSAAGLAACFIVSSGLAARMARRVYPARRTHVGLGIGMGTTLLVGLLAALTIFRPLAPPTEIAPLPPQAAYWNLPTSSRIAYLRIPAAGEAKATPIIRVHGGPGGYAVANQDAVTYFGQFAQDGYDVYLYDQIGSGLSARLDDPRGYTITRSVADLEAIRQTIGAEQMILIGESWGGTLVANYLAVYPDHVAKVIFSSPAPINPAEWREYRSDMRPRLSPQQQQEIVWLTSRPRLLAVMLLTTINPRAAHAFAPDREMDSWMDRFVNLQLSGLVCNPASIPARPPVHGFGFWAGQMVGQEFYVKRNTMNPRAQLAGNRTPTLILRGECDHIQRAVVDQYRTTFAQSTLVDFPGAGHIIYADQPDRYRAVVRAFLSDQGGALPAAKTNGAQAGSSRR